MDALGTFKDRFRSKAPANRRNTEDLIRVVDIVPALANPGRNPPRQKFRITLDIGYKIEKLIRRKRKRTMGPMFVHNVRQNCLKNLQ